jgi:hypothetical protein
MISNKLKTRHIRTTHSVAMKQIAARMTAIPEEKRTDENKRFLANFADEQKGITTISDVQERMAESAKTASAQPPASAAQEIHKDAKPTKRVAKKAPVKEVKGGKKK